MQATARKWILCCLTLASLLGVLAVAKSENQGQPASTLKAGAAVRVITPDPLLPISGGMGAPNPAKEKRGELTVRALVLQKGETTLALVGVDLLGFPSALGNRVTAKVPRIPADQILIGASHTHSAPDAYAFPDGKGGHTAHLPYLDLVVDKAAEAINAALDALEPAWLKTASGEAQGRIAYNYYAPDLYDRRMGVIQAVRPADGKPIATLVNYAIHPEVLGSGVGICSPDAIGPMCERIEKEAGGVAVFINGAQGGMITADNRNLNDPKDPERGYWNDLRTWDECVRIGNLMATEALRLVGPAQARKDPAVFVAAESVRFPVQSPELWAVVTQSPLKYQRNADKSINALVNLVNLGDTQIVTAPGEALPNIGFYLKRKMRGKHNLVFGLTNEAFGYILTKVDYGSFPRYNYVSRVSLGEMTGEILIEKALEMVAKAPTPDQ